MAVAAAVAGAAAAGAGAAAVAVAGAGAVAVAVAVAVVVVATKNILTNNSDKLSHDVRHVTETQALLVCEFHTLYLTLTASIQLLSLLLELPSR